MNGVKRVLHVFIALIMMACGVLMLLDPWGGFTVVFRLLMLTLIIAGLRNIIYYISMARHAVGGIAILYKGILLFDAGLFAYSLADIPPVYTMIYLIICMMVSGGIDMLRANEARTMQSGSWKLQFFYGAGNMALAIIAIFFLNSGLLVSVIYGISLIHSAVCRLITAFRRTAIVYIGEES